MKKFSTEVKQFVDVTLDETKFTEEWMAEFRSSFYPLTTVEDHAEHLAQLCARGLVDNYTSFIEGYGPPSEFGIEFAIVDSEIEVLTVSEVEPEED